MNYETGSIGRGEPLALPDYAERPKRIRRIVLAVALVAIAAAVWVIFGRHKEGASAPAQSQLPTVSVVVPGRTTADRTVSATGTLGAKREMPVGVAGEGGMITRVAVDAGQWVRQGQVLATVDRSVQVETAASLESQVQVAIADRDIAQAELERARALVDRGFISKADLQRRAATRDAQAARVKVAQATLAETRARNGRLDIRAPAQGLILARQAEPGQVVSSASGVLFRMAMDGLMEMRAQVAEADLQGIHVGSRASVTPVGQSQSFSGEVWQVSPVIDPQTRQGTVRVQLRYNPALRPGGFAATTIVAGASTAPMLPDSALQSDDEGTFVYVVGKDDKVERRNVKLGQVFDHGVVIAGGLNGTERVVRSAGGFLAPGQKVKPVVKRS